MDLADLETFDVLGSIKSNFHYSKSIFRSLARMSLRRRRDEALIKAEYHDSTWRRLLFDKAWAGYDDLQEFLIHSTGGHEVVVMVGGRLVRAPLPAYLKYRYSTIAKFISDYRESFQVVEIGCGWGGNLFGLKAFGSREPLMGLELSDNGITAAREIAAHFSCQDIRFERIDLLDARDPGFNFLTDKVVFSYYCLEQLTHSTNDVFRSLIEARPKRVLHIEPGTELLSPCMRDIATALHVVSSDYQRTLLRTAQHYHRIGKIRLLLAERRYYAPGPRNFPLVLVWEPV